jgi:hypothetical protein
MQTGTEPFVPLLYNLDTYGSNSPMLYFGSRLELSVLGALARCSVRLCTDHCWTATCTVSSKTHIALAEERYFLTC